MSAVDPLLVLIFVIGYNTKNGEKEESLKRNFNSFIISEENTLKRKRKYLEEKVVRETIFVDSLHISSAIINKAKI